MRDGDIQMLERGDGFFLSGDVPLLDNEVEQVLAEVPNYEQWFNQGDYVAYLEEENTNLKKLLKECCYRIDWTAKTGDKLTDDRKQKLFNEIEQVLKENNNA
jgi:hypothetical protein